MQDSKFDFEKLLLNLGFVRMEDNPNQATKAYKLDLDGHNILYIPFFGNSIDLITDFKPSFPSAKSFYEVYDLNVLQKSGDRLFVWGTCLIPQNQAFAEQLLLHRFVELNEANQVCRENALSKLLKYDLDPIFDFHKWLIDNEFQENGEIFRNNQGIEVHFDLDAIEIYKAKTSLMYCTIPHNQAFAEQLFAHCLAELTPKKSISILNILNEISEQYRAKAPIALEKTLIPATEDDILTLESILGESLPTEFRDFILHNTIEHSFVGNYACLSIQQIIRRMQGMNKLLAEGVFDDGRVEMRNENYTSKHIQKVWWSSKWMPFCEDSCGNMRCIDFIPAKYGEKYQILDMEVQDGMGPFKSRFYTFRYFLQQHLELLKTNQFTVDDRGIEIT